MLLLRAVRRGWQGVLAVLPAAVLARLDGWARRDAQRRAERRRRRLATAQR